MDFKEMDDRKLVETMLHAEEQADLHGKLAKAAKEELLHRKRNAIAEAYSAKGDQFGVIHVDDGQYKLSITTSARVEWDQKQLAALATEIRDQWQADPAEYIESKFAVKESKYKAWPSDLRAKFEPARTVKAAAPSLAISLITAE